MTRPKPPRDEDAEHLLRLCREGRLFELQIWIAAGRPLKVPAHYRHTPLHVVVDTGFHSLIELLLRHENDQAMKDDVLTDTPMTRNGYAEATLAVEIPEMMVLPYEWITETRAYRRFSVPATVVNAHGRVSISED